jgi:hypothetical protein
MAELAAAADSKTLAKFLIKAGNSFLSATYSIL